MKMDNDEDEKLSHGSSSQHQPRTKRQRLPSINSCSKTRQSIEKPTLLEKPGKRKHYTEIIKGA